MKFDSIIPDIRSSIVVFLVAVPLCLGISLASNVPIQSGLVSGIIGGIFVGLLSKSRISVSGPAAGMVATMIQSMNELNGNFKLLLLAVFFAGIFQVIFGLLKLGKIASRTPEEIINGMLSAIGVIIIFKQFPVLLGYKNEIISYGSLSVGILCLATLVIWDTVPAKYGLHLIPGALFAIILSCVIYHAILDKNALFVIASGEFVNIPSGGENAVVRVFSILTFPDFSNINFLVIKLGLIIAIIASLEGILGVMSADKIGQDPETPKNRELCAQGTGNILCGLLGGIPVTSVIIRSSVNFHSGCKTKLSTIMHGVLILLSVAFFAKYINIIPLSSLAAVLVYAGFRLIKFKNITIYWKEGYGKIIPFLITIFVVFFFDLLTGVALGILSSWIIKSLRKLKTR